MNILDYIPYGSEKAITMKQLMIRSGLSNREVRKAVSEARKEDLIINFQDGRGYFRPIIPEEEYLVNAWVLQEQSRIKTLEETLHPAKEIIGG